VHQPAETAVARSRFSSLSCESGGVQPEPEGLQRQKKK